MTIARLVVSVLTGLLLTVGGTTFAQAPLSSHGQTEPPSGELPPPEGATAGGITWTVPGSWTRGPGRPMRVATYEVPAAKDAEAGQCAVFFFGRGQGGELDANVQRWAGQFKEKPAPKRERRTAAGMPVTRVDVEGTYLNPGGGMMQSQGEKPGYRLLGAIVEGPEGNVFFKLTGPEATVDAAEAAFDGLLASLTRK
jgi:hypothetical protein